MEHSHYTITPSFFRNEEQFLKHCKANKKLKDNDNLVAIFNDQCKVIIGNPYITNPVPHRSNMPSLQNFNEQQTSAKVGNLHLAEIKNIA